MTKDIKVEVQGVKDALAQYEIWNPPIKEITEQIAKAEQANERYMIVKGEEEISTHTLNAKKEFGTIKYLREPIILFLDGVALAPDVDYTQTYHRHLADIRLSYWEIQLKQKTGKELKTIIKDTVLHVGDIKITYRPPYKKNHVIQPRSEKAPWIHNRIWPWRKD